MLPLPALRSRSPSVPPALIVALKCQGRPAVIAAAVGLKHRLYAWDRQSGRRFLVDTGEEVCVLPPLGVDTRSGHQGPSLTAVNGSSIQMYGVRMVLLIFGPCHFTWTFMMADVSQPLLGADFLRAQSLLVDVWGQCLVRLPFRFHASDSGVALWHHPVCRLLIM